MFENPLQSNFPNSLLKATEVADILNISLPMAYRLIQIGEIRAVQIGKGRRVRLQDLCEYIESNLTNKPEGNES
jgi:excisionase family DNA binding protein